MRRRPGPSERPLASDRTLPESAFVLNRKQRARSQRHDGPTCVLCGGKATVTDPEDGRDWCARDFYRLHAALNYGANVAAGGTPA